MKLQPKHPFLRSCVHIKDPNEMTVAVRTYIETLPISPEAKMVEFKCISRVCNLRLQRRKQNDKEWEECSSRWDFMFNVYYYRIIDNDRVIATTDYCTYEYVG